MPHLQPKKIYIFLNGRLKRPSDFASAPPEGSIVVAVDGGALHCLNINWPVHFLVGDFDSLSPENFRRILEDNPNLEQLRSPRDKDETDFELALSLIDSRFPQRAPLEVHGALGGRWDMTLANLLSPLNLSFDPKRTGNGLIAVFRENDWDLLLIRGPASVKLKKAKGLRRFSLIPLNGAALGVTLEGDFKYLVKERDLGFALTLGLSNELGSEGGLCRLRGGSLLICISTLDSAESLDELSQKRPKN